MRIFLIFVGLIVAAVVLAAIVAGLRPNTSSPLDSDKEPPPANKQTAQTKDLLTFDQVKEGAVQATLEIEGRGTMTLELYPKAAPKTVAHFVELCKRHFYDGILVHRVVPNFVFQAGDPASKKIDPTLLRGKTSEEVGQQYHLGTGGSGKTVPLEAKLPHNIYTVGLARSADLDSGDSQFYVNLKDNHSLDGQYCVFGQVTKGQDIAQKVQIGDRITRLSIP
jgi:cyclophilin family peptidyl-prolyl cis-trans isomerase